MANCQGKVEYIMKRISVLMSTYNGERYLAEQIKSIQTQEGENTLFSLQLFIRDDQSTDRTLEVINKFSNITIIPNNGKNIGVKESFFTLLRKAPESDLFFFSDQDDIWPTNKVKKFLEAYDLAGKADKGNPMGIFSDLWVADSYGNPTGKKMSHVVGWPPKTDAYYLSWSHKITGAAFAINNEAKKMIETVTPEMCKEVNMHDSFIALLISITGRLIQIDDPLLYYRQHDNNVIGANKKRNINLKIKSIFKLATRLQKDDLHAYEWIKDNQENFYVKPDIVEYFENIYMMSTFDLNKRFRTWIKMLKYMMSSRLPFTTFYLYVLNIKPKNKFWEF